MTSQELWGEILDSPADAGLRQRFVAALGEEGDARAEVFRLAAELKKYPVYYVQHEGIKAAYLRSLGAWRAELAEAEKAWRAEVVFVEGWPVEVTIGAEDFRRHAAEIVETLPVRHVNLRLVARAPDVFELPAWEQIVTLNGRGEAWSGEPVRRLANSVHVRGLRWVDLSKAGLVDEDVETLAASANLRGVEYLNVAENPCRDPVDASCGCGVDGVSGMIVYESVYLPEFGKALEKKHGRIGWLNALGHFMEEHPPSRYRF